VTGIVTYSAITSGAVVDAGVWSSDCASYRINDVDGIRARWGLMTGGIDPRWPFANCDGTIETQGPSGGVTQSLSAVSESGISGPDSDARFAKAADPDDATKTCYVMRREQGDESTLKRTELSFSITFTPVPLGSVCWIGFAIRIPDAWKAAGPTDETAVFQVHETPDVGDDTQPAPISMLVRGQGMLMWVRSNPNATTLAADTTYTQVWAEASYPSDQWQFFAVRLRSHWDAASAPTLDVWRRAGDATQKIVEHSGPNSYNNVARNFVKSGLYYYDEEWSGGITERQMHHKGLFQWLDGQDIDHSLILDHLQSI